MWVLWILLIAVGSGELAYGDCQADMEAIKKAVASSKAHGIEAKLNADAAGAAGAAASAGTAINPNAGVSSAAASQCGAGHQQGIDNIAKDLAASQKPTCQNTKPNDPSEEQKCQQCTQEKQKAAAEIKDTGDQVAAGGKGCQESKEGSDETKKESEQGSGQPPQMPKSESGSEEEKKDSALGDLKNPIEKTPAPSTTDCSKTESYNNPDCNEKVVEECTKGTGKNCEQFTFRYCSSQSSGGTGEGIGSNYCKKEVAKTFCKEEGRNQCPTCKQQMLQESEACKRKGSLCVSASTEQQLKDAKDNCPSDPIFTDPKNAMSPASAGGLGGSGSTGGGALGGAASTASSAVGKSEAVGEEAGRKNLDTSVSSGGGFSGYGDKNSAAADSSGSPFRFGAMGLKGKIGAAGTGASGGGAGAGNMLTSEVHGRTSKSIFMMSSEVYIDRCKRDLIRHCSPAGD